MQRGSAGWLARTHRPPAAPLPPHSCDKKLLELGWQEQTPWEEGLKKTVDWYLKHAKREYWWVQRGRSLGYARAARAWQRGSTYHLQRSVLCGAALLPAPCHLICAPLPLPPTCRTHGDMELALDAHPTLQVPYMGSTAVPFGSASSGALA